jgi:hypothetical protein
MTDNMSHPGLKGTVLAVASNAKHEFNKPIRDEITLIRRRYGLTIGKST